MKKIIATIYSFMFISFSASGGMSIINGKVYHCDGSSSVIGNEFYCNGERVDSKSEPVDLSNLRKIKSSKECGVFQSENGISYCDGERVEMWSKKDLLSNAWFFVAFVIYEVFS